MVMAMSISVFRNPRVARVLTLRQASSALEDIAARLAIDDTASPCRDTGMSHAHAAQLLATSSARGFQSTAYTEAKPVRRPRRPGNAIAPAPRPNSEESQNLVIREGEEGAWIPVLHKQTGLTYWWNQESGETTALGELKPGPLGRRRGPVVGVGQPMTFGRTLVSLAAMGAGVGLVFGIIGRIF